jgi:hypothetical protein
MSNLTAVKLIQLINLNSENDRNSAQHHFLCSHWKIEGENGIYRWDSDGDVQATFIRNNKEYKGTFAKDEELSVILESLFN